jgi:hypothetical protein
MLRQQETMGRAAALLLCQSERAQALSCGSLNKTHT